MSAELGNNLMTVYRDFIQVRLITAAFKQKVFGLKFVFAIITLKLLFTSFEHRSDKMQRFLRRDLPNTFCHVLTHTVHLWLNTQALNQSRSFKKLLTLQLRANEAAACVKTTMATPQEVSVGDITLYAAFKCSSVGSIRMSSNIDAKDSFFFFFCFAFYHSEGFIQHGR